MNRLVHSVLALGLLLPAAARAATIFGLTNDCEVQITLTNPPYAITGLTNGTLLPGTSGAVGKERCAVIPFQLPSLGAATNPFLTTAFTFNYESKNGTVAGNLDVYGLGRRASAMVLTNDYWTATNAVNPTDATLLEDGIITANSTAYGLKTSSFAGSAALTAYLNAQYAGGAGAGQFVFLRLSTDTAQTGGSARYLITAVEGAMAANDASIGPQLAYTLDPGPLPPPPVSIIASDSFDKYTSGALAGQGVSGFGWASGWVAGAASTVTNNSDGTVIYAVPNGGGLIGGGRSVKITGSGAGIPATRALTIPQTNTFYAGFLIDVSGNPNTGDTYALYLNNSATDTTNGVNAGLRGDPANGAYFFLGKGITAPGSGTLASGSGTITDTRYLVLKIEKTAAGKMR